MAAASQPRHYWAYTHTPLRYFRRHFQLSLLRQSLITATILIVLSLVTIRCHFSRRHTGLVVYNMSRLPLRATANTPCYYCLHTADVTPQYETHVTLNRDITLSLATTQMVYRYHTLVGMGCITYHGRERFDAAHTPYYSHEYAIIAIRLPPSRRRYATRLRHVTVII